MRKEREQAMDAIIAGAEGHASAGEKKLERLKEKLTRGFHMSASGGRETAGVF